MHSRKYQVEKSSALGLLLPQNLRLEVRELDEEGHDLGLLYETTNLKWWECMATLPPKFLVLSAGSSHSEAEKAATTEINAAVAKVTRPLGNLPPGNRARIEMGYVSENFKFGDRLPSNSLQDWQIRQRGFKRHYTLQPVTTSTDDEETSSFTWRGSRSVLSSLDTTEATTHGNLKFQGGPNNQLLAAWKQRRDSKILGTLYVFDDAQHYIPLEVLVTSCLYVVVVERILWTTFVGH